jgi:PPK2 family polyphosphate:nucleotide phosphotransferase
MRGTVANIKRYRVEPGKRISLDDFDPRETSAAPGDKTETSERNGKTQQRLSEFQELLYAEHKHKVLIVLQGMDTSGKDGTVQHVMGGFDPSGVTVVSFKKPSAEELEHDYLWRVHKHVPGSGEVVVFNRSQYEDVLVVRVHDLVPKDMWSKRYEQINDFERMLSENGTIILKFFLHISKDEQKERLQARIDDPTKRWKFQHGDIEERKLWKEYREAYEDVLSKTSTRWAPWWIIPADRKWYRNFVVGTIVTDTLKKLDMKYPEPDLSIEKID